MLFRNHPKPRGLGWFVLPLAFLRQSFYNNGNLAVRGKIMAESAPEYTADFLLEFLPDLLPKPIDSAAKAAVKTFKDQLDTLLAQPRLKRELLEAAQQAELNFRMEAQRHMKSDKLVQAVASLPLFDREMFQKSLASLPDHLNEDYLAKDLQDCIADDWKGEFSPDELREGVAVYLNCLRVQLLKVSGFAEVIARLVTLRIDTRTATIQAGVEELLRRTERRPWKGVKIQVWVEGNLSGFTISKRDELIGILAALLRIEKDQIRILRVSSGSVVIELQLPEDAASELYELHRNRDSRLANLGILSIVLPGEEFAQNLVTTLFTIPAPVQDFTGREAELEKLKAEFTRGAVITGVSGGGGIGKTELARKLAYEIADDYPDARMSIDLLGTSEKPMLSEEVMRRLLEPFYPDQKLPDDETQLKGLYQQTFATKKTLLLLDNASNAAQVRPLIPPAPSAAIITSRQHFSLTEFGLKEPLRLDVLSFEQSRELLRSASSKFNKLSDDDIDKLTVLCGRLPLALRVAASLLNDRSDWKPDDLLKQLRDEHTRLERLKREDDQDFDVEATLSLSYKLLNEDLKKYFRMLAVFTAPFPALSAQAIWNIENEGNADDMLGKLVNRNLLDFLPAQEGKGGLYVLHDLTRLYATRRLLEHKAEAEEVVSRHAAHFLEWASDANNEYKVGGEHIVLALEQFRFIWPELLLAWERLLPDQRIWPRPQSADVWLSEFPSLCGYLLDLSIPPRSLTPFLNTGLDAARRISNKEAEGILLSNLGLITERLGDSRSAVGHFEQALIILRESGNLLSEGATLNNLGAAYLSLGEFNKAIEFYKQSLIIDRKIGNRRGEGAVLGNLGVASKNLGRLQDAIEYYEQALAIAREIGDRRNEGGWLGSLGLVYTLLGDAKKAVGFHEEQILIAREIGDQYSLSNGLGNLGFAQLNLGNFDMAIKCYEQALEIDRMRGDRHGEGEDIGYLGSAYADLEDLPHALEYFEDRKSTRLNSSH